MKCQAIASSTKSQCKKNSLPGSHYCVHHYPKVPILIAFFIGIVTSLIIPRVWDAISPPHILREIQDIATPIPEIAEDVKAIRGFVHSSSIKVELRFLVNEKTSGILQSHVSGSRDKVFLHTKSKEVLTYVSDTGSTSMTRGEKQYTFSFSAKLPPEKNPFQENADEFLNAIEIEVPLKHFIKIMGNELSPKGICSLTESKIDYFVNSTLVQTSDNKLHEVVDRDSTLQFILKQ